MQGFNHRYGDMGAAQCEGIDGPSPVFFSMDGHHPKWLIDLWRIESRVPISYHGKARGGPSTAAGKNEGFSANGI
jgi:hypothetical protein